VDDQNLSAQVRRILSDLTGVDAANISRTDVFGDALNFSEAVDPFKKIQKIFSKIKDYSIDSLSDNQLSIIFKLAKESFGLYESFLHIKPNEQNDFIKLRSDLIDKTKKDYHNICDQLAPIIAFSNSFAPDENELNAQLERMQTEFRDKTQALEAQIWQQIELKSKSLDGLLKESQNIVQNQKELSGEFSVTKMANYFDSEAIFHREESKKWGRRTLSVGVAIVSFSVLSFYFRESFGAIKIHELAQLAVSKALVFFTLAYLFLLSARSFSSHKHNEIVNRHRHNALRTFKTLADAASMSEGKDLVLSYAAACIFAPQETGYVKPGNQPELPSSVIKSAVSKLGATSTTA
jgi:hypothetical protein